MSEVPKCECGRPCGKNGQSKHGKVYYKKKCNDCRVGGRNVYRHQKKPTCEECGFVPINKCQLDVDHVDGNHQNNAPENLRTLCANCHRLKTYINKETLKKA